MSREEKIMTNRAITKIIEEAAAVAADRDLDEMSNIIDSLRTARVARRDAGGIGQAEATDLVRLVDALAAAVLQRS